MHLKWCDAAKDWGSLAFARLGRAAPSLTV